MAGARTFKVIFDGDTKGLARAADEADGKLKSLGNAFGGVATVAGGFLLGNALAQGPGILSGLSVQGAQLELQQKKTSIVFGESIGTVQAWADANAHAMGLTKTEAKSLATGLADLLIPMGMTRDEAARMSTDTIGLSGALAEWSGGQKSAAEVADVLTKAYLGETDGLKALGISISASDVAAQLALNGQDKLTGAAKQQAEALVIEALVLEKSNDARVAWAEGTDNAARKQATMNAKIHEAKEAFAQGLQPAMAAAFGFLVDKGIPAVEGFIETARPKVKALVNVFSEFLDVAAPKVKEFASQVGKYWESDVQPALENVQKAVEMGIAAWEKLQPVVMPILEFLGRETERVAKAVALSLGIIVDLLGGDWGGAWNKAKEIASLAWDSIEDRVRTAKEVLVNLAPLVKEGAKALGNAILDGLADGVSGATAFAGDIAETVGRALKQFINANVIDRFNRAVEFDFGFSVAGKDFKFRVDPPDIPHLAKGGLIIAGDNPSGIEAVVPLERAGEFGFGRGGGATVEQHVTFSGFVGDVGELLRLLDLEARRQGRSLFASA